MDYFKYRDNILFAEEVSLVDVAMNDLLKPALYQGNHDVLEVIRWSGLEKCMVMEMILSS